MKAVRGAITVENNSKEEIYKASQKLFESIMKENSLSKDEIISVIFTMTGDLTKGFPSTAVREKFGLNETPFLDLEHKYVEGALEKCIRVMIFVDTDKKLKPVYLGKAKTLRKDLEVNNDSHFEKGYK